MALGNNPTPNELVKAVKALEQGGGGTSTDVQVDSTSITSGGVADIKSINGDYDASTNKFATQKNIPLYKSNEYKAFAFIDQFVTTSMDYFLPTEISMFDCSKLNDASLEVGDKILVFAKLYTTNADISDYNYVKTRIYLSTITGIYPIVQMFDVQSVLFNINNTSGRNLYRTMAFRDEIPTYTFDTTPTQNSQNPVTSGGVYDALANKEDLVSFTSNSNGKCWRFSSGLQICTGYGDSKANNSTITFAEAFNEKPTIALTQKDVSSSWNDNFKAYDRTATGFKLNMGGTSNYHYIAIGTWK